MDTVLAAESNALNSGPSRTKPIKRLISNQRVSACVGAPIPDANGIPTKKRERVFGYIVNAVGNKQYLVKFDGKAVAEVVQ